MRSRSFVGSLGPWLGACLMLFGVATPVLAEQGDAPAASDTALATAERRGPAPLVIDAAMAMRLSPGDSLSLLGGDLRLTYRPSTTHCIHLLVEAFGGSTLAPDAGSVDATLVSGSVGALWGFPGKRTFFGVGVAADLGYARLAIPSSPDESGFVSSVGMRALLRSRLKRGFHVHAALALGGFVRPLTARFATASEGLEGLFVGVDLGASFDLARTP